MAKRGTTKFKSDKQEKRIAKDLNAKVTIASGALDFQKADVRNDTYLVEAKTTEKDFYPLSISTWEKIQDQATKDGLRIPVMCIDLEDGRNSLAVMRRLDVICMTDEDVVFVGKTFVPVQAKRSYRVKADFLTEDFPQDVSHTDKYYRRHDVDLGKHSLTILEWEDFLYLYGNQG